MKFAASPRPPQSHHHRSRILVAAVIGLIALGGISVANAADGDQQYTGCLKNGTLSNVAIGTAPSARCPTGADQISWSEQGTQGEPGIQGEEGPQGRPGEPGLDGADGQAESHVWFARQPHGFELLVGGNVPVLIASVNAPAGSYRVDGRLTLWDFSTGSFVDCHLAGSLVAAQQFNDDFTTGVLELTVALVHPGGPIDLTCQGPPGGKISVGTLLLTQVSSVN